LQVSGTWYCSHDCSRCDIDDLTANIRNLASGKKVETPEANEAKRIMNFINQNSSPAAVNQQDVRNVGTDPESSNATTHAGDEVQKIQKLIADCSKPAVIGRAEQTRRGSQRTEEKRLMDFIKDKSETAEEKTKKEADTILRQIKEKEAEEKQKRQKQLNDVEKKQKEHERFTEWVAWAQGEIAKKKANESSDEDA